MKKLVLLCLVFFAMIFTVNVTLACDCGCKKGQPCTCEKCDCKDTACAKKCDCDCEGCKTGDCSKCDCKDCDCENCKCKEKTTCDKETSAPCEEKCEKSSCDEKTCKGKKSFFGFLKRAKGCPVEQ